jgi:hypothetical protein
MIENLVNIISTRINMYNLTSNIELDYIFIANSLTQSSIKTSITKYDKNDMIELLEKTLLFLKDEKSTEINDDIHEVRKLLYGDKNEK